MCTEGLVLCSVYINEMDAINACKSADYFVVPMVTGGSMAIKDLKNNTDRYYLLVKYPGGLCVIYGSEIDFNLRVSVSRLVETCQDICDNVSKYSAYKEGTEEAYYSFLKYLWVSHPDGTDKRVVDYCIS